MIYNTQMPAKRNLNAKVNRINRYAYLLQQDIDESHHEIKFSNNVVCATSKASDQPAHTHSLIRAFANRLNILCVQLLTEHHMEFLSLKGDCTDSSEYIQLNATLSRLR